MGPTQIRVFKRVALMDNFPAAIDAVTAEVNAFLATFSDPTKAMEIRINSGPAASQVHYVVNVIYRSEP